MKRILLALALAWGFIAPAGAQAINTVPQVGVISAIQKSFTYSAVSHALVPAASATDIFCISAGSARSISVKRISISGTATTQAMVPITIVRRASLDTGGTPAVGTALPVAAANNPSDPASNATLIAYTANPTINDASPLLFRSNFVGFPVTSSAVGLTWGEWHFGEYNSWFAHAINITKASTQQVCVNLNANTITGGSLEVDALWTESP